MPKSSIAMLTPNARNFFMFVAGIPQKMTLQEKCSVLQLAGNPEVSLWPNRTTRRTPLTTRGFPTV